MPSDGRHPGRQDRRRCRWSLPLIPRPAVLAALRLLWPAVRRRPRSLHHSRVAIGRTDSALLTRIGKRGVHLLKAASNDTWKGITHEQTSTSITCRRSTQRSARPDRLLIRGEPRGSSGAVDLG